MRLTRTLSLNPRARRTTDLRIKRTIEGVAFGPTLSLVVAFLAGQVGCRSHCLKRTATSIDAPGRVCWVCCWVLAPGYAPNPEELSVVSGDR